MKQHSSWENEHCKVGHYNNIPPGSEAYKEPNIYLNINHLQIQHSENIHFFLLFRKPKMQLVATLCFVCDSLGHWISLPKAPFGCIIPEGELKKNEVLFLLTSAQNFIENHGGKKIIIVSPPEIYDIVSDRLRKYCYAKAGYKTVAITRNHFISVTGTPFEARIRRQELRRLKKCLSAGLQVTQEVGIQAITAFNEMTSMRKDFGYTTSITVAHFEKLLESFPEQIRLFSVYDKSNRIAVAVTVHVNAKVIYNFLSAYARAYREYSPTIILLKKVYELCQHDQIEILDLGISLDHLGAEKPSLIRFKENLGAQECMKTTWEKCLYTQTVT